MTASIKSIEKLGLLEVGLLLDVKDLVTNQWKEATIIEIDYFKIKVQFINEESQYKDEWIHCDNELGRLEKHGKFTKHNKKNKKIINLNDENFINYCYFDNDSNDSNFSNDSNDDYDNINININYKCKKNIIINQLQNKVQMLENKLNIILKQNKNNNNNNINIINELTLENKNLKEKMKKMTLELENLQNIVQQYQSQSQSQSHANSNEDWEEIVD